MPPDRAINFKSVQTPTPQNHDIPHQITPPLHIGIHRYLTARVRKLSSVQSSSFMVAAIMRFFASPSPVAVRCVSHEEIKDIYYKSGRVQSSHGPILAHNIAFRHQYMCHMSSRQPELVEARMSNSEYEPMLCLLSIKGFSDWGMAERR